MSKLLAKAAHSQSTDIAIPDAGELVVMESPRVPVRAVTCLVHIRAWGVWNPGTGTTGVSGRIYRWGDSAAGVIGEVNLIPRAAGLGSSEVVMLEALDMRSNADAVQYVLSLQAAGATGAGAFIQGAFEVEVLSG